MRNPILFLFLSIFIFSNIFSYSFHIITIGPPLSGVFSTNLAKVLNLTHINCGQIIRDLINSNDDYSLILQKYIDKGSFIPDHTISQIIVNRLLQYDCYNGWVLDGFPRTINQSIFLDQHFHVDYVINLEVEEEELKKRMENRRYDPVEKKIYQYTDEVPQEVANRWIIRPDDQTSILRTRLHLYQDNIQNITDHFSDRIIIFNNSQSSQDIRSKIVKNILPQILKEELQKDEL